MAPVPVPYPCAFVLHYAHRPARWIPAPLQCRVVQVVVHVVREVGKETRRVSFSRASIQRLDVKRRTRAFYVKAASTIRFRIDNETKVLSPLWPSVGQRCDSAAAAAAAAYGAAALALVGGFVIVEIAVPIVSRCRARPRLVKLTRLADSTMAPESLPQRRFRGLNPRTSALASRSRLASKRGSHPCCSQDR